MRRDQYQLALLRADLASKKAVLNRRPGDPAAKAAYEDAQRVYAEASLREHIAQVVSKLPPLTNEQRANLAALLRPSTVDAASTEAA